MYRQERAGRTEQDTARTESDSEIQRRTGQPNNDELRSRTERGGRKRMGHEPKERERATTADPPNPIGETIRNGASSSQPQPSPFATGVVGVLFFTLAECTLPYFGEEGRCGRGCGERDQLWGWLRVSRRAHPIPAREPVHRHKNRTRWLVQVRVVLRRRKGFVSVGDEGRERSVLLSAADGGVCGVGEKSGRKCWSVYNESGVGFSSITDSLSSFVAHVGESTRDEEASESSDAADETCESVGGRACRSGVVPGRSLPSEGNRRMPQQLCGHILNINLRHVQSEWSVGSASAGQRRATRERSGLVFANFSGIRCLLASPDCRIDPAGSVPLVGSLVCGRFVNKLDFGFTTHGASELGSFTFGAVRTLGAD
ncbi:hypothetical protein BLNAU_23408 [Blattamonas nauphoetae]|uniref:Uncharacterized protein n=1 Tax=Blattamonas nauphoetae TaxID=2049346 RepID=A0ABQ9WRH3_9EUKA|nr:hypothetical protein BLNAU_23408 [Blattamonas nauphoetae]